MLNINIQPLIGSCHDWLQGQHPRTPVHAEELADAIGDFYIRVRDVKVALVAEWLFRHFGLKLSDWLDDIAEKVAKVDEPYYLQLATSDLDGSDPEERANCAAAALAVVLFYRAEDRGEILYSFSLTKEEAAAWLDQNGQKVLRQGVLL